MISVIVPVYNVEHYVGRCLASIANQSYGWFEAIIVDDGSTDASGIICDEYCRKDKRFRVIHQHNAGTGFARNTGLDNAKGQYVLFVDGDDSLVPDALRIAHEYISHGYDWVGFGYKRIAAKGDTLHSIEFTQVDRQPFEVLSAEGLARKLIRNKVDPISIESVCTKLYTRSIIGDLRFAFANMAEDACFNYHIYLRTKKAAIVFKDLYCYHIRSGSLMSTIDSNKHFLDFIHRKTLLNEKCQGNLSMYRVLFLRKIYRMMATHRAFLLGTEYYTPFLEVCRDLRKETSMEYLHTSLIPFTEKTITLLLWGLPHIGRFIIRFIGN